MSDTVLIAIIAAIPGLASLIVTIAVNKNSARKDEFDRLTAENERLLRRIEKLESEADELREHVDVLTTQVRELGQVPKTPRQKATSV
jgi:predicted nuclease with TOPRIM domain